MNDGQNANATEQTTQTQTMADIASTIEGNSAQTEQQQTQTEAKPTDNVADFQQFVDKQTQTTQDLTAKVDQIKTAHDELVNSQHREAVNKEINSATQKINEAVGGDEDMARLYLETQYQKNADLKKVWDNRKENPEALDAALKILGNEWAAKNQNVIDPQVAENQRALQDSQRAGGTIQGSDLNTKLDSMSDGEFMNHMRKLRSS